MPASNALIAPRTERRLERARAWLAGRAAAEEVLVVAASRDAANELLRRTVLDSSAGAAFGWHRATLLRLAAELAQPVLIERDLVPVAHLSVEAVVARVIHELLSSQSLGRFTPIADRLGFPRAVAGVLEELRLAGVSGDALGEVAPELRTLLRSYEGALVSAGLADRALVLGVATERASDAGFAHPWLGLPTLLLDVPVRTAAEQALVAALLARAPEALATIPEGDDETRDRLGLPVEALPDDADGSSLAHIQAHLFGEAPPEGALGEDVDVLSAPGESRECVEIARKLLERARAGVPFDLMAVLLRSPEEYRPQLEEAFGRAGIPAHFARGAIHPDPAGRAFVALLACAGEGLSARRFAEYLSLGEVPDATSQGQPPPALPGEDRWVAPDEDVVSEAVAEAMTPAAGPPEEPAVGPPEEPAGEPPTDAEGIGSGTDPETAPVVAGTLRAPRRWEQLLVDAAVIGGRERWERRLRGLAHELELDLGELDDPEDSAADAIHRQLADLEALQRYALPLLDELTALPESASWGDWLDRLSALATRALRGPERVLATLAQLAPMAGTGPVDLTEVQLVLSRRLLEVAVPPPRSRHGGVFVAPIDAARGLAFDVVCVPGLAEKLFPRQIREEPIVLDRAREQLGSELVTNEGRVRRERLALRMAVGAARKKLILSYPRLDLEKGRPRVPSFYALEALRAGEGRLPGFGELAARAETVVRTRIGWPAPPRAADAIDEAEHDLALLDSILTRDEDESVGTARYLLDANPHLGRALRFRARRWLRRWTPADGLVEPGEAAAAGLRNHRLGARSFSATALEKYSDCPYRFFLHTILRLAPREVPEPIDVMPPLQRGSLVHQVQYELFLKLDKDRLLPVTSDNLAEVRARLDAVLDDVAARFREDLAPAIDRVWTASVEDIRADLREWLRRLAEDDSGFVPWRFELAFGLQKTRDRDPASVAQPVALDCGIQLRGSIDLVERKDGGQVRVTDHKTGRVRMEPDATLAGGKALQPVLYALAAEKLFPDQEVTEGRLYYCTATGGFEIRPVAVDERARKSAQALADAVDGALAAGFLPAYPDRRACRWCDYAVVCGPYEELRTSRKPDDDEPIAALRRLRDLP